MIERILITVKTYPTLSSKYAELVCTAGVNENGDWRRIYPVRFRQLQDGSQYKKYQWIEADIQKSTTDGRPESFKIANPDSLKLIGDPLPTTHKWQARKEVFQGKVLLETDLAKLIAGAHANGQSLAHFQPTEWLSFVVEKADREWDSKKLALLEAERKQQDLFKDEKTLEEEFKVVQKLPYKFSYRLKDASDKKSTMMIEDWEIGALYWKCLQRAKGDEAIAVQKVREKYWDSFVKSGDYDLTVVLGTTLQHHNKRASNPYVIISVVPTPHEPQMALL
jgi:uncharacterized protein YecA (UPF0149 family)